MIRLTSTSNHHVSAAAVMVFSHVQSSVSQSSRTQVLDKDSIPTQVRIFADLELDSNSEVLILTCIRNFFWKFDECIVLYCTVLNVLELAKSDGGNMHMQ